MDIALLIVTICGWIGAGLTTVAYAAASRGLVRATTLRFNLVNLIGGALLALNAAVLGAWPSMFASVVWVAVGAIAISRLALERARARSQHTPEPEMSPSV